jgi:hypothetical protein
MERFMSRVIGICFAAVLLATFCGFVHGDPESSGDKKAEAIKAIKEFPAIARKELEGFEKSVKDAAKSKQGLATKVAYYRGTEGMSKEVLTDESNGFATIKGYEILIKERKEKYETYEKGIKSLVADVKKGQEAYKDGGGQLENGEIPSDVKFTVKKASGDEMSVTLEEAKKLSKGIAEGMTRLLKDVSKYEYRSARLTELVAKLEATEQTLVKFEKLMNERIAEMKALLDEIEADLRLIDLDKDYEAISKALAGEGDNAFGKSIAKAKKQSEEMQKAGAELGDESTKPSVPDKESKPKEVTPVDHEDYWR